MADSDPRKIRPLAQSSDRRSFDAEEDPLMELARIVSEDSGFYGTKPPKSNTAGVEPIDRNAPSVDLEAELLQELESSFASPPPQRPAPRPAPQAVEPPVDDADDLLRSIEAQLGEFERRTQSGRSTAGETAGSELKWASEAKAAEEPAGDAVGATVAAEDKPLPDDEATAPVEPSREEPDSTDPQELPARPLPTRFATRLGRGAEAAPRWNRAETRQAGPYVRPRDLSAEAGQRQEGVAAEPPASKPGRPALAGAAAGWSAAAAADQATGEPGLANTATRPAATDFRRELRTTFGGLEEGHQTSSTEPSGAPDVEAELTPQLEPSYSDPTFGGHWQDAAAETLQDEPHVAAVAETQGVPLARAASRDRPRRGMMIAAGVLGAIVLGAAVAAYLRAGGEAPSGPPPVIAAQDGAVKVEAPPQPQAEGETVGEAVYNRVAGDTPPAEEQVVDSAEEPREISRIVLPPTGGEAEAGLAREVGEGAGPPPEQISTEPPAASAIVGPRRVRTYVVRPDGTILATSEAPAGAAAPAEEQEIAMPAAIDPVPVRTTAVDETGQPGDVAADIAPVVVASEGETVAAATAPSVSASPATAEASATTPEVQEPRVAVEESVATPPAAAAVAESAATEPPAAAAPVAPSAETEAPVEVAAAPTEASADPAPVPAEGHYVQLSSQREEAQAAASLASMQSRYPSILGGINPDIQRADLGAKGIYYRARVGPFPTRPEAIEVCEKLKAAGSTCIVTR